MIFATAAATSVAAFREVDKVVDALRENESIGGLDTDLAETNPGKPQTIMLLGSDRRPDNATDGGAGTGARSDTIILVRLDPDRGTALMSLPRDLKVEIPGHGTDKINAAYELGGPKLTLQTVKRLTGLPVNHVINVDFNGFKKAVDALGCIYLDIDRRYFNDSAEFAYINIYPGYQRLCGEEALEYARFRHEDTDLVRSARQQEVLREAKQQIGAGKLINDRDKLIRIFGKYTTSDAALKNRAAILRLLKLAVFSVDQPLREVHFEGEITDGDESTGVPSYVTASDATVKKLAEAVPRRRGHRRPARQGQAAPRRRRSRRRAVQVARERQGSRGPHDPAGRGEAAPRLLPHGLPEGLDLHVGPARLPDQGSLGQDPARLPHGDRAQHLRRVLRGPGHHLEEAADPRQRLRREADGRPDVRDPQGRRPRAPGRLAHRQGRLLGLEHPAAVAQPASDAGRRALDAAPLTYSLPLA